MGVMAHVQGPDGSRVSLLIVRQDEASGTNMPPFDLVLTRRRWITAGAATDPGAASAGLCTSLSTAASPHSPLAAQASGMSSADDFRDTSLTGHPAPPTSTDRERATPAFQEIVQIFKTLDKNGDGRISHGEFLGGLRRLVWKEYAVRHSDGEARSESNRS